MHKTLLYRNRIILWSDRNGRISSRTIQKGTEKHPPVYIRQNAVRELYAGFFSDILKIPYDIFMENEIQEWYVIESYFSQIIEEYWRKHYG